jgi:hypothetical protein
MSKSKKNGTNLESRKPSIPIPDFLRDAIGARLDDPTGREAFPTLYEALAPKYEGATQLTLPGKLTVTVVGASWIAKLDLPTYVLQAQIACASLHDVFPGMEAHLRSGGGFSPGYAKNKKRLPTIDELI